MTSSDPSAEELEETISRLREEGQRLKEEREKAYKAKESVRQDVNHLWAKLSDLNERKRLQDQQGVALRRSEHLQKRSKEVRRQIDETQRQKSKLMKAAVAAPRARPGRAQQKASARKGAAASAARGAQGQQAKKPRH